VHLTYCLTVQPYNRRQWWHALPDQYARPSRSRSRGPAFLLCIRSLQLLPLPRPLHSEQVVFQEEYGAGSAPIGHRCAFLCCDLLDCVLTRPPQKARDKLWNLSKTVVGLSHRFYRLRDGRQLHYLISRPARGGKPLVILIHGFPDSCAEWRHLLEGSNLLENATVVAVDMPGYGASDGFDVSTAPRVLEALTEFIVAMREEHIDDEATENGRREDVILVGHDWGCVTAYRLAAESPNLADRWILSNGPMVRLDIPHCRSSE
jgi:hypothetical protein